MCVAMKKWILLMLLCLMALMLAGCAASSADGAAAAATGGAAGAGPGPLKTQRNHRVFPGLQYDGRTGCLSRAGHQNGRLLQRV